MPDGTSTMRAFVYHEYGQPDVLELREVEKPPLTEDSVLVRVHATSVNPVDWHTLTGIPYMARLGAGLRRPKEEQLGVDFAGTVEAVGAQVTTLKPGDEVFGARNGAFAEYVCVREDRSIVPKPANISFEEAAAVPVAAVTALQGLRDKGRIQSGQRVLVNGASGGVGTYAVQIAKSFGTVVTGVCSTHNIETARSLGADEVVDYTKEDFIERGGRYDLVLDIAGGRSWREWKRVLADDGRLVVAGGPKHNRLWGPMGNLVKTKLASVGGGRTVVPFLAKIKREDVETLRALLESGQMTSVIDRRYEFGELPEALRYLGEGHARGKVVVAV
jgi:NADPH:quinone reductase-like Zn-dependent oxidoreductase